MNKSTMLFILLSILIYHCDNNSTPVENDSKFTVESWLTRGDTQKKLEPQPELTSQSGTSDSGSKIDVSSENLYQEIDGFGAALTNSSAWLLYNSTNRDELMNLLFSREEGIGISYIRLPMGASDFTSQPAYTYNDRPQGFTDLDLLHFSIAPDEEFIIPILKQALSINPELKIMASPWTAPAWMKVSGSLNGGELRKPYYQTYANYFVKFIEAYEEQGITIDAITVQNEPLHSTGDYPSMYMVAGEQADFIKNYLGPAFVNNNIQTKIIIYDHNWDRPEYPLEILNDVDARNYIDGTAWHCYGGEYVNQSTVYNSYPSKNIYFTECSGGGWDTDFASVLTWNFENLFIGATRHWARTVLLWNLALDENDGPHIGGCNNCRGVITIRMNDYTLNPEYYIIGHLSKFVMPGAHRIASDQNSEDLNSVAFINPDGSIVLIILNKSNSVLDAAVNWKDQHFIYENLPERSVVTLKW